MNLTTKSENLPAQNTPDRLRLVKTKNSKVSLENGSSEGKFLTTGFSGDGAAAFLETSLSVAMDFNNTGDDPKAIQKLGDGFLAMMAELKPQDGFEGILISQMVMVYKQSMRFFDLSNQRANQTVALGDTLMNRYVKLMRLYTQQLEVLDRHRRKGEQTVTVQHVNVNQGGQAIVGTVNQGGGVQP